MNNVLITVDKQLTRVQLAILTAVMLLQVACPSWATVTIATSASARTEYDSNVFDLQSGFAVPGTTDFQRSDWLYTYGAGFDANYLWERQKLFLTVSDNEFHYDHFSLLDHNEYTLDAGLNWKLFQSVDGTIDVMRNHTMVAFTNVETAVFVLQTEERESAKVGYEFIPDWRIEGSGDYRTVDQSFAGASDLDLREYSGLVALQYLGRAGLTTGVSGGYTVGNYSGSNAAFNPSYTQTSVAATAVYQPTGRSKFNGALGYSERKSPSDLDTLSGFTGELDYDHQLTGKTTMHVQASRNINSYVTNVGSEIDTVGAFNLHWQATYKLGVIAGYNWTTRELPGQNNDPVGGNRTDHLQYVSLNIDYHPNRWLSLKPYFNYQTRSSNFIGGDFNASVIGVFFTVQWQNQRQPDPAIQRLNLPAGVY